MFLTELLPGGAGPLVFGAFLGEFSDEVIEDAARGL